MTTHHQKTATLVQPASVKPPSEPTPALAPIADGQPYKAKSVSQEMIRDRAYQNWETGGKPKGNSIRFWLEAEKELWLAK